MPPASAAGDPLRVLTRKVFDMLKANLGLIRSAADPGGSAAQSELGE